MNELTVNEDNHEAVGFYEHMGFKTYKRTDTDEEVLEDAISVYISVA